MSLWELGRLKKDYKSLGYSTLEIESHIQKIPDHPKPGILFYDISTLIFNAQAFDIDIASTDKHDTNAFNFALFGIDQIINKLVA